jgi:hypothetical protein
VNPSDDLGQALAGLATRADTSQPKDRLDNIHRRARRATRTRVGVATLAAVLVFGSAAAIITRSHLEAGGSIGPATESTATAQLTTTATGTGSATPTASTGSTGSLVPADYSRPVAGGCLVATGSIATVDANPDVPSPRCTVVRADQRLRVVNTTNIAGSIGKPITVTFANYPPRVVQVGQATVFDRPMGEYLAVGVHRVHIAPLYGGGASGAEVWLK